MVVLTTFALGAPPSLWAKVEHTLTPKRMLSYYLDFATSRRDARQLLIGQDCIA